MPFGSVVSIGRGSVTFRISFETRARFGRPTWLVGMDLSSAGAPWPSAVTDRAADKVKPADARTRNLILALRFIKLPFPPHGVVARALSGGHPGYGAMPASKAGATTPCRSATSCLAVLDLSKP